MNKVQLKLRISRDIPQSKSAKTCRITDEALVSLRTFRRDRLAKRILPHQPKAA